MHSLSANYPGSMSLVLLLLQRWLAGWPEFPRQTDDWSASAVHRRLLRLLLPKFDSINYLSVPSSQLPLAECTSAASTSEEESEREGTSLLVQQLPLLQCQHEPICLCSLSLFLRRCCGIGDGGGGDWGC